MQRDHVTSASRVAGQLTAQEAAHAMPVLQAVHAGLRDVSAPRLATIRHLARRNGISDGTLRTALSRACSTGSLRLVDGRYVLGPVSVEQAAAAAALRRRIPGYDLAVVLEGARSDLRPLRELFARQGFRPMQRSMWVGARTVEDRLSVALRQAGFEASVVVFHCDEVDAGARARLAGLWNLTDRAVQLRNFHHRLFAYIAAADIDRHESAWRCVEAAPIWYRIAVQDEPPFPIDICASDYPLEALNQAWRNHLESMTEHLTELWAEEGR